MEDAVIDELLSEAMYRVEKKIVHEKDFEPLSRINVPAPVIYDIGANTGQSIASFRALLPSASIHVFELNPTLHEVLFKVAASVERVTIYPFGLSDQEADVEFQIPVTKGVIRWQEASMLPEVFKLWWIVERLTNADPNYTFLTQAGKTKVGDSLGLPAPDIIKVDVEGAEFKVIAGLEKTIDASSPLIVAENSAYAEVRQFLERKGYKAYAVEEGALIAPYQPGCNTLYVRDGYDRGLL